MWMGQTRWYAPTDAATSDSAAVIQVTLGAVAISELKRTATPAPNGVLQGTVASSQATTTLKR